MSTPLHMMFLNFEIRYRKICYFIFVKKLFLFTKKISKIHLDCFFFFCFLYKYLAQMLILYIITFEKIRNIQSS